MPTYCPYTRVADLPANSRGETTVLEAHLDAAHATIVDLVQFLIQALWSAGGVVIPGTVTNPSNTVVRAQDRLGVKGHPGSRSWGTSTFPRSWLVIGWWPGLPSV